MSNFWKRTISAVVYVILFVGCIYSGKLLGNDNLGVAILTLFLLFVGCGCTFEFYRMVGQQGAAPSRWIGYLGVILLTTMLLFIIGNGTALSELWLILTALTLLIGAPLSIALQLWKHSDQPFRDAAYSLLPPLYIGMPMCSMLLVAASNANLLMMLLIIVWMNDNGAYMGGSLLGKHKMWQRHSPGKTWEGTAIGVLVAMLTAIFIGPLMYAESGWLEWGIIALVICVASTLGDLAESMLKRSVGVKDSGNIMPGHGGFLDRFDSLLFAAPVMLVWVVYSNSILNF
ncbi:MAG: phosphatidate cytidylyltransferase [Bacteroidales bacterium]|nr:phosphatidate cytidylyltransferase [Bacteroidales bacterium]